MKLNLGKEKESNKGITLIALIVTIIVIIILAGISVNLLLGQNGLLQRAKDAKTVYTQSELEERVNLAYLDYKMQKETGKDVSLDTVLNGIEGVTITALAADTTQDTFCVEKDGLKVTVNTQGDVSQGEVKVWKGANDIKCPRIENGTWYIDEPAQLNFLAYYVNNGCSLTGTAYDNLGTYVPSGTTVSMTASTIIELTSDLDMGARKVSSAELDGKNAASEAYETANASVNWTPIGLTAANVTNLGTFDGKNHTVKNMYVNRTANFSGVFGNSSTIQNLTIANSYIKGGTGTGGIVGSTRGTTSKIENCHNINTTVILREGTYQIVGGIAGQIINNSEGINNCTNTGTIIGYSGRSSDGKSSCGGVIGSLADYSTASNCINYGNVKGFKNHVGGVIGTLNGNNSTIENSRNYGNISINADNAKGYGGIVGFSNSPSHINNCSNMGDISKANNLNNIYYVGGITGELSHKNNETNSSIERCYNSGKVEGSTEVGGIVGYLAGSAGKGTVKECYNKGTVTGTEKIGSIVGAQEATAAASNLNTLTDLYYQSTVGIGAIDNGADDTTNHIEALTAPDGNFNSKEEFLTWLDAQKASRANT